MTQGQGGVYLANGSGRDLYITRDPAVRDFPRHALFLACPHVCMLVAGRRAVASYACWFVSTHAFVLGLSRYSKALVRPRRESKLSIRLAQSQGVDTFTALPLRALHSSRGRPPSSLARGSKASGYTGYLPGRVEGVAIACRLSATACLCCVVFDYGRF